jgi:hypothetical protein
MRSSRFARRAAASAPAVSAARLPTLQQLVASRGERLPLSMALTVGLELSRALEAQHAAGRVRGALGLAVVGFSAEGRLQLLEGAGDAAAPEVLRGEQPDVLSDVYALGAVLYQLLTGRSPTQARGALGALPPAGQLNPAVDGELELLVASMLAPEVDARPFTLRTVEAGLKRVFDELELSPATAELRAAVLALPVAKAPPRRAPPPPVEHDEGDDDDDTQAWAAPQGFDWRGALATTPVRVGLGVALALALAVGFWPASRPAAAARAAVAAAPAAAAPPASVVKVVPVSDTLTSARPAAVIKKVKVADGRHSRRRGPG